MPQTAIVSPQIIDSTSIGRDLITAADQAAAQAILGVTGVDTSADYTWTGDNTFEGTLTADYIEWSNINGIHNQPNINGFHFFAFGGSNVFRASSLDFIPMSNGTKALGRSDLRFSDVYSVDGDFSGTVTFNDKLQFGTTDTNTFIRNVGEDWLYWSVGGLTMFQMSAGGNKLIEFNSNQNQDIDFRVGYNGGRAIDMDGATGNVTFGSDIISSVGGSYKLYNLGTEGDADTEYLTAKTDTNDYRIVTETTGTGVQRDIRIGGYVSGGFRGMRFQPQYNQMQMIFANAVKMSMSASAINISTTILTTRDQRPFASGTYTIGTDVFRWSNVYSVDGDFSGTVTSNNFEGDGTGSVFLTQPSAGSPIWVKHGTAVSYALYNTTLRPAVNGVIELGLATNRWEKTWSVGGSFSGNLVSEVGGSYKLYNLGTEGDADTEYLEMSSNGSTYSITTNATGTGTTRNFTVGSGNAGLTFNEVGQQLLLYGGGVLKADVLAGGFRLRDDIFPLTTGTLECGTSAARWSNVYSVAGSFTGRITNTATTGWAATFDRAIRVGAESGVNWFYGAGNMTKFSTPVTFESSFQFARAADGLNSRLYRMSKAASAFICVPVDGGVTGNTIFQVEDATNTFQPLRTGGIVNHYPDNSGAQSYRMYNLGESGDVDTEYGELSWNSNILSFGSQTTGTGVGRDLRIISGLSRVDVRYNGNVQIVRNNATYLIFGSANMTAYKDFRPSGTNAFNLGSNTNYWARTFSSAVFNNIETITAATDSLVTTDTTVLCDCSSNNIALTIPTSSSDYLGNRYEIKKIDSTSNTVTITPTSRTIDGAASKTISTQYESITIVSDGTNWFIV